jgi:hypothetical protein
METLHWIFDHWVDVLQSIGIVAGLLFTVRTIRTDENGRRIANLIAFTQQYREIWRELYERPELARVLEDKVDLRKHPVTAQERLFVKLLILHLDSVHRAMKENMFVDLKGLQTDIQRSFSRPIFRAVWEEIKGLQNPDFIDFVEGYASR